MCNNDLLKINAKKSLRRRIAHLKTLGAISGLGFTALVTNEANAQNGMPIYAPPVANPFGLKNFKTYSSESIFNPCLVDIDNDGDLDIFYRKNSIYGSYMFVEQFFLVKNIGSPELPKFGEQLDISSFFDSIVNLKKFFDYDFCDIDNDSDLDLFLLYNETFREPFDIIFFENISNSGELNFNFVAKNPFNITPVDVLYSNAYNFDIADFDGDSDDDILCFPQVTYINDTVHLKNNIINLFYKENIGNNEFPNFSNTILLSDTLLSEEENLITSIIGGISTNLLDYDQDGDMDLVLWYGRQYYDGEFYYHSNNVFGFFLENTPNDSKKFVLKRLPNINQNIFTTHLPKYPHWDDFFTFTAGIDMGDLDNDGDVDLIGIAPDGYYYSYGVGTFLPSDATFHFFENIGNSNNTITGAAFHDKNSNGIFDNLNENNIPHIVIEFQNKNQTDIKGIAITDTAGKFIFPALDDVYVLKPIAPDNFKVVPSEIEINAADSNYIYEQHFALQPLGNLNDLACQITSGPTRPGFVVPFWLTYKNVGTTKRSGTLVFKKNDLLTFNMASSTPDDISADAYAWNFNNLPPFESKTIYVEMTLSATANLGDTLTTILGIIPIPNDANPTNNLDTLNSIIVGSFDPNDKLVTPTGTGVNGNIPIGTQPLEYTVRFQNTGTDTAFNVVVQDSLDLDFDWSTFKILASSHEVTATTRNNNKIKFTFEDIELPHQAVNEPASHGFVKYSLQPKSGLVAGTKFHNTANIYFDYNAPIETNTTVNTFFVPTGVYDNLQQSYRLFPNPMYEKAVLQFDNIFQETFMLRLVDATGKTIKTLPVDGNQVIIERRDLAPGMYIFTLEGQQTMSSGKLMVE